MAYKIIIKQGNIVQEKADFIVNASNTKLILGSGVSMAFKRHCGIELQKELDELLQKYQKIEQGEVVLSSSGEAKNFEYALHCAIMNYNNNTKIEQRKPNLTIIYKSLENIEKILTAEPKNNLSIALPLIGCGIGGLDKISVISLYKDFFSRDIIKDIKVFIYGFTQADYKLIKTVFKDNK
jgi:O-acetyl-ADP-ribose deacetylase (regulator of RNase III)